jgi:hypothetical protein
VATVVVVVVVAVVVASGNSSLAHSVMQCGMPSSSLRSRGLVVIFHLFLHLRHHKCHPTLFHAHTVVEPLIHKLGSVTFLHVLAPSTALKCYYEVDNVLIPIRLNIEACGRRNQACRRRNQEVHRAVMVEVEVEDLLVQDVYPFQQKD